MEYRTIGDELMFPTGVGMNRRAVIENTERSYVPHRRGDEPLIFRWR